MAPVARVPLDILERSTVAELLEYYAEHHPESSFTVFPGESVDAKPSHISWLEFSRATQRLARAIYPDAPIQHREVVGLLVHSDSLMWLTAITGIIRAGATVFPISPRNSPVAICHILRSVSAHRLVVTEAFLGPLVYEVVNAMKLSEYDLKVHELPQLPTVYPHLAHETANDSFTPIALPPRGKALDGTTLYIHSSGSTGLPKSIPITEEVCSKFAFQSFISGVQDFDESFLFATPGLPEFHIMGVWLHLMYPLYSGRPSGIYRPTYPAPPPVFSPATILEALKALKPTSSVVLPSILEEWVHDATAVEVVKNMNEILYGGGPLSGPVGDLYVAHGCKVRCGFGTTEVGIITRTHVHELTPEEWAWCEFASNVDVRWRPEGDGTFELQILRGEKHVVSVENLPDTRGYSTRDLWQPHPTKKNLWQIVGRADDVLVLANGEKVVPIPIEGIILAHPAVRSVVAFGHGRTQIGVIVEPAESRDIDPTDETALTAFRNDIWESVDKANHISPAFARVYKEMILVATPTKRLPRGGKGNIQRKAATALYEEEINAIYDAVERPGRDSEVPPPIAWNVAEVSAWLATHAASVNGNKGVTRDVDLFQQGFDSLSATFLRNRIISALRDSTDVGAPLAVAKVDNNFIYAHPIISDMAQAIVSFMAPGTETKDVVPTVTIQNMIERYSHDMPDVKTSVAPRPAHETVLLTGSTGSLGSELLAMLLGNDRVQKVYALNRPSTQRSSLARHEDTFQQRGLDALLLQSPKVVFLEGEASSDHLGLSEAQFSEIRSSMTLIIHNAWRLDFNLTLPSFETSIRGTRHLLDLAIDSAQAAHVRVLFTSSIAVTQSWPRIRGPFPEEPQDDAHWCVGSGYGESKYVCEQLLAKAAEHGLKTISLRIGQISGGQANGAWAVTDWLPILVRSSIALGCLPDAQGVVSWLPFEAVGQAIVDVALNAETPDRALNLVHPRPVRWHMMIQSVAAELARQEVVPARLPVVSMSDWFSKLSEAAANADPKRLEQIPAIKLLEFFRAQAQADVAVRASGETDAEAAGLSTLSTTKSQRASRAMRELKPLGDVDVGRWIGYWKSNGMFTGLS